MPLPSPSYWLQQAGDLEGVAKRTEDAGAKRMLLDVSAAYRRLAQRVMPAKVADRARRKRTKT
jgi:hypothetical protein